LSYGPVKTHHCSTLIYLTYICVKNRADVLAVSDIKKPKLPSHQSRKVAHRKKQMDVRMLLWQW